MSVDIPDTALMGFTVLGDALACEAIILDNERWNSTGINEDDISVCFEMGPRCEWGSTFTVGRLHRALKAVRPDVVTCVEGRWFPTMSVNASARRDAFEDGRRTCARAGCKVDLTDAKANVRYCSTRCRDRAYRQTSRPENRRNKSWSETRKTADFRESGTCLPRKARPRQKTTSEAGR